MSGTIPLSMTQQFDVYGKPLAGGQLFIILAGTVSTPQDAFVDTGLTIKQPYPMTLDAAGRVPQFFLDNSGASTCKVRLQDKHGVVQLSADQVLIIGPAGGGGGGATVDQRQLIQTGMMMFSHTKAVIDGFVRANGRTIGPSSSGASERNDPDCQALFLFLWPDLNLTVSGGRGASAAADWALGSKNITLPDWRGCALSGLDDMGNVPATRLTNIPNGFAGDATVLGARGGNQNLILAATELPVITPTGGAASVLSGATCLIPRRSFANSGSDVINQLSGASNLGTDQGTQSVAVNGTVTTNITINPFGGGAAHRTLGPRKLITFYIKL